MEIKMGEAESRNAHFQDLGAGSEDWVNAMEFMPGQPYCCPTAPACTEAPVQGSVPKAESEKEPAAVETKKQLCSYAPVGEYYYKENCVYLHGDACDIEEPQRQKVGTSNRYQAQWRNHFWELIEERENSSSFDNNEEEVVTFDLGEMLLMFLAGGGDDELTDSEDEWNLFHDELEDFYDLEL
ncbi:E3 ubiquitin-protein ligase makorin-1 [Heterocephalus glaber]|uniref:E3 ubiquitin-protein ligase makorin-1 n=1 Tax=Heterocephalus glaber TaxID=10181 RepID=G5C1C3_HETGA|nr:E3 ubiquitin-protein ligase makorin-1 [Heterocephalus glaber]